MTTIKQPKETLRLARNLRRLRDASGESAYALARRIGISLQTYLNWEHGKRTPRWDLVCWMADAMEVSTEEFRK